MAYLTAARLMREGARSLPEWRMITPPNHLFVS